MTSSRISGQPNQMLQHPGKLHMVADGVGDQRPLQIQRQEGGFHALRHPDDRSSY